MSPFTDPPSSDAVHVPQTDEPQCAEQRVGNTPEAAAMNPFLVRWLHAIASDGSLPSEALEVAIVITRSVGIGRVAFTDWQRVNVALGRKRTDYGVFDSIRELQSAGYLGRFQGNRYNHSRGWSLSLPEVKL